MIRIFQQYVSIKGLLLILLEGVLMAAAVLCAARIRFWNDPAEFGAYVDESGFLLQGFIVVAILQLCLYYSNFYNPKALRDRISQTVCLGQSLGGGCLILGIIYFIFPSLLLGRGVLFVSVVLVGVFVTLTRVGLDRVWAATAPTERILILGTQDLAVTVARELERRNDLSIEIAGFLDSTDRPRSHDAVLGHPILGNAREVEEMVARHRVTRIIVAVEDRRGVLPTGSLVKVRVQGVRVEDAHTAISALSGRVWLRTVKPSWFVFSDGFRRSRITLTLKRVFDLVFAGAGLLASLPVMLAVAIAVRLDSPGPIFYRQSRVGLGGRIFDVLKFRSMCVNAEAKVGAQWAAQNDSRVTRVGRWIRKFRLDELPQFLNVIRGEMSFVGPRPERPFFVDQLREQISYYDERHSVRPGLTGWAQVRYPYGSSIEDAFRKLEYDLFYLKNMSVFFDFLILLQTVRVVCTGNGGR